jgi:hypothetical protein
MALSRAAADSERSGFIRAIAAMALCQESRSEGLHALHELSRDQKAIGFHRVFHFAMIAVEDERATRLSALSNDPTLPGVWRIFAAEELLKYGRKEGINALRAIQHDTSVNRWARMKASIKVFIYSRISTPYP